MKNIIIMMGIAMMCYTQSFAQKLSADKVPAVVKTSFEKQFPTAKNVVWETEQKDKYEAGYTDGKQKQSALYDKNGKWLTTETEIEISALPKAVSDAFAKEYPGYKIKEAEHLDTSDSGELYEVEVSKSNDKLEIQYSPSGKMVKKETMKGKD